MISLGSAKGVLLPSFSFLSREDGITSQSLKISQQQQKNVTTVNDRVSFSLIQQLSAQASDMRTALKNTAEAKTVSKIAKDGISDISSNLKRMKALAEISVKLGTSTADRAFADAEFQSLARKIDNTILTTKFDGTLLLGGATVGGSATSALSLNFDISGSNDFITLSIDSSGLQNVLSDSGNDITTVATATTALTDVDNAINALNVISAHVNTVEDSLGAATAEISSRIGKFQQIGSEIERFQQEAALAQIADGLRDLNGDAASTVQDLQVQNLFARLLDIEQPETENKKQSSQDKALAGREKVFSASASSNVGTVSSSTSSS